MREKDFKSSTTLLKKIERLLPPQDSILCPTTQIKEN